MFLHENTLTTEQPNGPWFIKRSRRRARRIDTAVSKRPSHGQVMLYCIIVSFVGLLVFGICFNAYGDRALLVLIPTTACLMYPIYQILLGGHIRRHWRKYIAEQNDYSFRALFHNHEFSVTDDELDQLPSVQRLLDAYFIGTAEADRTISDNRHGSAHLKKVVQYTADSVYRRCMEAVEVHRTTQLRATMNRMTDV